MQQSFDDLCLCEQAKPDYLSNQKSVDACNYCTLEKEKQQVARKAFERALGISLFLIDEIDKIGLKKPNDNQVSKQEILNLLKGVEEQNTQITSQTQ